MIFDNNIKPSQLLYPIFLGLITFSITIVYLNNSLQWQNKEVILVHSNKTSYNPDFETLSNYKGMTNSKDTLSTPFIHNKNPTYSKRFLFNRYPMLLIWIMSVGVLIGFGFSFIPIYWKKIFEYKGLTVLNCLIAISIIMAVIMPKFIGNYISGENLLMPKDIQVFFGIGFTDFAVTLVSFVPFVPIFFWIINVASILEVSYEHKYDINKIKVLKSEFEILFIFIAIILGLSIFCNNIYNTVINEILQATENFKVLPNEIALVNIIIYSFVLILSYIFISGYLNSLLINNATDQTNTDLTYKSYGEHLKVILSMMAPLLGGWVADLVKLVNV